MAGLLFIAVVFWALHNYAEIQKLRQENAQLKSTLGIMNSQARKMNNKIDRLKSHNRLAITDDSEKDKENLDQQ